MKVCVAAACGVLRVPEVRGIVKAASYRASQAKVRTRLYSRSS